MADQRTCLGHEHKKARQQGAEDILFEKRSYLCFLFLASTVSIVSSARVNTSIVLGPNESTPWLLKNFFVRVVRSAAFAGMSCLFSRYDTTAPAPTNKMSRALQLLAVLSSTNVLSTPGCAYSLENQAFKQKVLLGVLKSHGRMDCQKKEQDAQFGKFVIPSSSIFYRSDKSVAFVNLRPIIPGHVLVIPSRSQGDCSPALLSDLTDEEYTDLWTSVQSVQAMLKRHYKQCTGFNVAVQDGRSAGQSVPHAHVHILPRSDADAFAGSDDVYTELEEWAPRERQNVPHKMEVVSDQERRDRTKEEMANEAASYRETLATM